jgi:hypothetical protein
MSLLVEGSGDQVAQLVKVRGPGCRGRLGLGYRPDWGGQWFRRKRNRDWFGLDCHRGRFG